MSYRKRMHVLDFIINVLKVHEKELDNKIDRLEMNVERIENLIRTIELLILQEKPEDVKPQVRELLDDILETQFSL